MTRQNGLSPSILETVAGFTAGIASTLSLHPLDLIKTRLQGMVVTVGHQNTTATNSCTGTQLIEHPTHDLGAQYE